MSYKNANGQHGAGRLPAGMPALRAPVLANFSFDQKS